MSEALILASTNSQYDSRLFIELPVHNMKIASSKRSQFLTALLLKYLYVWVGRISSYGDFGFCGK